MRKREEYQGFYVYSVVDVDKSLDLIDAFEATLTVQVARPINGGRGVEPLYSRDCKTWVKYVKRGGEKHIDSDSRLQVLDLGIAFGKFLVDFVLDMFKTLSGGWIGGGTC